jgi:hypothetical protein
MARTPKVVGIGSAARAQAPAAPTREDALDALVARAKRGWVPLRKSFVQQGERSRPRPGPLAALVAAHAGRTLDLYLLVAMLASHEPYKVELEAQVWARLLGMRDNAASRGTVSKMFRRLEEDLGLVERGRHGRVLSLTMLREDGSREPYTHPGAGQWASKDPYLKLPAAYWTHDDRYYERLDLPAKAMLLIALSMKRGFYLPFAKAPDWYGISPETASKGMRQLVDLGLVSRTAVRKPAPLAPKGFAVEWHYGVEPPLGRRQSRVVRLAPAAKGKGA